MKRCCLLCLFVFLGNYAALAQQSFSCARGDSESGLYNCRSREFDPETGAFLQKDPVGVFGGINTYSYCKNDPINHTDPTGTDTVDNIFNLGTGVADALTFGTMKWLRSQFEFYDGTVDYCSGSYVSGQVVGTVTTLALGAGGAALGAKGLQVSAQTKNIVSAALEAGQDIRVIGQTMSRVNAATDALGLERSAATFSEVSENALKMARLGDTTELMAEDMQWVQSGIDANSLFVDVGLNPAKLFNLGIFFPAEVSALESAGVATLEYAPGTALLNVGVGTATLSGTAVNAVNLANSFQSENIPVGGVLLDKAATLVGQNLSEISGAMYDPVSGQFVILGTNTTSTVKNINLDYLYTALQAVYGSAQPPFVTLNPSASAYTAWTDFGNGNGIFEPGEYGGLTIRYNPIWPNVDTTVDVIFFGSQYGTPYQWRARFALPAADNLCGVAPGDEDGFQQLGDRHLRDAAA